MKLFACLTLLGVSCSLQALHKEPWFGPMLEFELDSSYANYRFRSVQNGAPNLQGLLVDQDLCWNLSFVPWSTISFDMEFDVAHTSQINWSYRSAAGQLRYQVLDDIVGDPVSLVVGFAFRNVSKRLLRSVSTIYHGMANFEGNITVGKEWAKGLDWQWRSFISQAFGSANTGSIYSYTRFALERNLWNVHFFSFLADGYFGFGSRRFVPTDDFHGWGLYRHKSVQLAVKYRVNFSVYGSLSLEYMRTVYARTYPENANLFVVSYDLPFSLF